MAKAKKKGKRKVNAVQAAKTKRNKAIIKAWLKGTSSYSIAKEDDSVSLARVNHIIGAYLMQQFRAGKLKFA